MSDLDETKKLIEYSSAQLIIFTADRSTGIEVRY